MIKCHKCKGTFEAFAMQLSLLDEGTEICPFCATSAKEGKFTEDKTNILIYKEMN